MLRQARHELRRMPYKEGRDDIKNLIKEAEHIATGDPDEIPLTYERLMGEFQKSWEQERDPSASQEERFDALETLCENLMPTPEDADLWSVIWSEPRLWEWKDEKGIMSFFMDVEGDEAQKATFADVCCFILKEQFIYYAKEFELDLQEKEDV